MLTEGVVSSYFAHAATDDGIVHLAELSRNRYFGRTGNSLLFRCRRLVIDGWDIILPHLRGYEEDVSCMACIARGAT